MIRKDGDEVSRGGLPAPRYIVELPIMDQGLESRPPTQLLLPTPPVTVGEKSGPRTSEPPKRRRIVGPDE
jgi:hypothetical protein